MPNKNFWENSIEIKSKPSISWLLIGFIMVNCKNKVKKYFFSNLTNKNSFKIKP